MNSLVDGTETAADNMHPSVAMKNLLLYGLLAGVGGCVQHQAADVPAPDEQDTPPAQFARFMETFTRLCRPEEEPVVGLLETNATGRGFVRVVIDRPSYQIHLPREQGDPYTAEVAVRMHSYFSSLVTVGTGVEEAVEANGKDEAADSALADEAGEEPGGHADYTAALRSDLFQRTYDFAHEQGRWVLKTPDVMESMRQKIELALQEP